MKFFVFLSDLKMVKLILYGWEVYVIKENVVFYKLERRLEVFFLNI